jgi:DNA-binding MltR family transcriptional regulator
LRDEDFEKLSDEDLEERVCRFHETLTKETDRGCALMAAAYLDSRLCKLLKQYFVDDEKTAKDLLAPDRPLYSFSARIDLAYMLGLVSSSDRKALRLIKKIRNEFGHVPEPITFDGPAMAERCKELEQIGFFKQSSHRAMFIGAMMAVLARLDNQIRRVSHRKPRVGLPVSELGDLNANTTIVRAFFRIDTAETPEDNQRT